jgi:hypothetical protein
VVLHFCVLEASGSPWRQVLQGYNERFAISVMAEWLGVNPRVRTCVYRIYHEGNVYANETQLINCTRRELAVK